MSIYVDKKYILIVSRRLDNFKAKSEYLYNFKCPICGDSKKNKFRARGYFFRRKNDMFFTCHNCNNNYPFSKFLSIFDPVLYGEYNMEVFKEKNFATKSDNIDENEFKIGSRLRVLSESVIDLPTIKSLPVTHLARKYVSDRRIPEEYYSVLYYASDFKDFVNQKLPEKAEKLPDNEKRLIIPFWDEKKVLLGFQGRALSESKVKYITMKLDETNAKVYGLDRVDFSKTVYVTEGPIDSLFLPNAIASMDASLQNIIPIIGRVGVNYVFIYDNEPRNVDVLRNMRKAIDMNLSVVIWPSGVKEKDINDMFVAGRNLEKLLRDRTFDGIRAKLEFEEWKMI